MLRFLTFVIILPFILSCDSTFDASRLENDLAGTSWLFELAETDEGDINNEPTASQRASITFGERVENETSYTVNGYNGCNAFSGKYTLGSQSELTFSEIVQTERACPEEEARIEAVFNQAIQGAKSYSYDGEILVIEAPGPSVKLRFIPSTED